MSPLFIPLISSSHRTVPLLFLFSYLPLLHDFDVTMAWLIKRLTLLFQIRYYMMLLI